MDRRKTEMNDIRNQPQFYGDHSPDPNSVTQFVLYHRMIPPALEYGRIIYISVSRLISSIRKLELMRQKRFWSRRLGRSWQTLGHWNTFAHLRSSGEIRKYHLKNHRLYDARQCACRTSRQTLILPPRNAWGRNSKSGRRKSVVGREIRVYAPA